MNNNNLFKGAKVLLEVLSQATYATYADKNITEKVVVVSRTLLTEKEQSEALATQAKSRKKKP